MALEPAKIITGRVTYADTGKPVPHAEVVDPVPRRTCWPASTDDSRPTPRAASARIPLGATAISVSVSAPEGQPYLQAGSRLRLAQGGRRASARPGLAPRRGDPRQGHRGRLRHIPIAEARVSFRSRPARVDKSGAGNINADAATAADGSFQLAVLPGPGYLVVLGPSEDYVLQEIGQRMLSTRASRAADASMPTPSSPATRNRAARAWRSTSRSAGA